MAGRIILTEADFRILVAGGVVKQAPPNPEITLKDIGWDKMFKAVGDAKNSPSPPQLETPI
jgi:hypothetical protein